ncbi:hypothetical protein [Woeseia oceani]|uniref:Uncharacterized protein n=1 Tax=Woeseia oceani TaxID=1548547 RepID=A0A193LFE2_9GAMM|nr:hypothetical protein [Woeseia oceani]ANO51183.1 hypothetical protein BA177_08170 [Woeseia oceani]
MPGKKRNSDLENDEANNPDVDADDGDDSEEFDGTETVVMSSDSSDDDDDLDVSMEVNVEKLMAEMEKTGADDVMRKKEIRRRLEEIQESRNLDDTYSFDLYGDD